MKYKNIPTFIYVILANITIWFFLDNAGIPFWICLFGWMGTTIVSVLGMACFMIDKD